MIGEGRGKIHLTQAKLEICQYQLRSLHSSAYLVLGSSVQPEAANLFNVSIDIRRNICKRERENQTRSRGCEFLEILTASKLSNAQQQPVELKRDHWWFPLSLSLYLSYALTYTHTNRLGRLEMIGGLKYSFKAWRQRTLIFSTLISS